jgi:hypothetical protein
MEYINSENNACVSSNASIYSEMPWELHAQLLVFLASVLKQQGVKAKWP